MPDSLASLLVGDHLGQVKKILWKTSEVSILPGCVTPNSSNPVVSIEPFIEQKSKRLIANKQGQLHIYDCIRDITEPCDGADDGLNKALPTVCNRVALIYDQRISIDSNEFLNIKQKIVLIKDSKISADRLALVGQNLPLRIFDLRSKKKLFDADPPEKDWLWIKPDVFVSSLDFVGPNRVATCSRSDSVIRVYDTQGKSKPVITIDINQTAFNEHADSARFMSIASTGTSGHSIVVGSNVGQILAIDLRFNVKQIPKKKLQPKTYKVLGGFKGARGGSIKDLKIFSEDDSEEDRNYKVVSCSLDRYLRIHDFNRNSRNLDRHIYMTTKPLCCSPVFYA